MALNCDCLPHFATSSENDSADAMILLFWAWASPWSSTWSASFSILSSFVSKRLPGAKAGASFCCFGYFEIRHPPLTWYLLKIHSGRSVLSNYQHSFKKASQLTTCFIMNSLDLATFRGSYHYLQYFELNYFHLAGKSLLYPCCSFRQAAKSVFYLISCCLQPNFSTFLFDTSLISE